MHALRLTAILVSRFLLNLQHAEHKAQDMSFDASGAGGPDLAFGGGEAEQGARSLVFERFVGSLGSSISFGAVAADEEYSLSGDGVAGCEPSSADKDGGSVLETVEMERLNLEPTRLV